MDTNTLLDALKTELGVPSDYALARNVFKIKPLSLKEMRERGMSDDRAIQVADMLGLNRGEVLAAIHAERAKNPEVKAAWLKVAESVRTALGTAVVLIFGALLLVGAPSPAQAGSSAFNITATDHTLYVFEAPAAPTAAALAVVTPPKSTHVFQPKVSVRNLKLSG